MATPIITKEQLRETVPARVRTSVTTDLVNSLNALVLDESFREQYRENIIGFSNVIANGQYKLQNFLEAVRFVTFKFTGSTDKDAYKRTFPDRYERLMSEGADDKTVSAYVSTYKKNKLVQQLLQQNMIPVYIANADTFQKAINVQAQLMMSARSEKVRSDAANSLLSHLKPPELKRVELDIGYKQDSTLDDLREATQQLVAMQREQLESRTLSAKDIAATRITQKEEIIDNPEMKEF
jgi:hypothetical protein